MTEYLSVGCWVLYIIWFIVWMVLTPPANTWSVGQWVFVTLMAGPVAWAIAVVCGLFAGVAWLWNFLGRWGKPN
jgi:hypothetical protein